jgi:hypothetical protein
MNVWMDRQMDGKTDSLTDRQMNGRMDRQTDRQMDEWMDRHTDKQIQIHTTGPSKQTGTSQKTILHTHKHRNTAQFQKYISRTKCITVGPVTLLIVLCNQIFTVHDVHKRCSQF